MTENSRDVAATPEQVWDVLSDGWLYPLWVVGATRMRAVDLDWPAEGARLHHSVGTWPVVVDDETRVTECRPGRLLRLRAKAWPGGEAEVVLTLDPKGEHTTVTIEERVVKGPGRLMPRPAEHVLMKWRNTETLRRLAHLVEGRARHGRTSVGERP